MVVIQSNHSRKEGPAISLLHMSFLPAVYVLRSHIRVFLFWQNMELETLCRKWISLYPKHHQADPKVTTHYHKINTTR